MAGDANFDTSPTLLGRLGRDPNDRTAWDQFAERYTQMITRWCKKWGLQEADADDVTQNVLLQLVKQMSQFQYDPAGRFRSWLKTVAYRAWCDFLDQRQKKEKATSGGTQVLELLHSQKARDNFLEQIEEEWKRELLEQAMRLVQQRVQPHTWDAFCLLTRDGLSAEEVGNRLDMKPGAVWVAKSKVQKMIKEEITLLEKTEQSNLV